MRKFKSLAVSAALVLSSLTAPSVLWAEDEEEEGEEVQSTYIHIKPAFVTNVVGRNGRLHFIKADIALRVRGTETAEAISHHDPLLKNRLIMLLSGQELEMVATQEGRNDLRVSALEEISLALEEEEAANDVVDVLFTNFLIE